MINNWSHYMLVFFITLMLGYFLGITIATVVDYRLKDAVVNMPTPKNTIKILVDKKPKNVKIKSNHKKIENFLNYKDNPKKLNIEKINNKKKKIIIKKKSNKCSNKPNLYNPVNDNREKYYSKTLGEDACVKTYSKLYENNKFKQLKETRKTPFIPYNEEDNALDFMTINKNDFVPIDTINLNKDRKKFTRSQLPLREKRSKNFKCQRKYMTCTSNHIK